MFLYVFSGVFFKQYVEENERLRSILAEWSARAAKVYMFLLIAYSIRYCPPIFPSFTRLLYLEKLERALEVERMSNMELQKKILRTKKKAKEEFVEPT